MEANHNNVQERKCVDDDDDDDETKDSIMSNSSSVDSSPPQPITLFSSSSTEEPTTTVYDGYDPKRIPSSVFASKSGKGIDWSVASNESLFSIHMGNNSLSRDQIAMLYKSGELAMLDQEYSNNNNQPPTSSTWQPPLPRPRNQPINIVHVHVHVPTNTNNNNVMTTTSIPPEGVLTAAGDTPSVTHNSTTSSCSGVTMNSSNSTNSFHFPILQNEQMERNNSQKVEEDGEQQNQHSEKNVSLVASEEERNKEEEMAYQKDKQPQMSSEKGSCKKWFKWGSSWFSCSKCIPKPTNTSSSSSKKSKEKSKTDTHC